jgi:hypothetical protein
MMVGGGEMTTSRVATAAVTVMVSELSDAVGASPLLVAWSE